MSKKENPGLESNRIRKILVPIDGSDNAKRALNVGLRLARSYEAELVVLNVIPAASIVLEAPGGLWVAPASLDAYYEQQEKNSDNYMDEALKAAEIQGVQAKTQVARAAKSVVEEIIEIAAHEKVDLIVIGTRGLGGFRKLLQGSVSSAVVTHAPCNVMVVR